MAEARRANWARNGTASSPTEMVYRGGPGCRTKVAISWACRVTPGTPSKVEPTASDPLSEASRLVISEPESVSPAEGPSKHFVYELDVIGLK